MDTSHREYNRGSACFRIPGSRHILKYAYGLEERGCILTEINGEPDHIHVLFDAGPEVNLLDLVRVIKTKTSRFARSRCKEQVAKYYWKPVFWSDSYFITTVGENTKQVVQEYIKHQGGR